MLSSFLLVAVSTITAAKHLPEEDCQSLKNALKPDKVKCGKELDTYKRVFYTQECADIRPFAVVIPTGVDDVQKAVRFAAQANKKISVRGVGHTYTCNSMLKDSVNLDMRGLGKQVKVTPPGKAGEKATMKIAPGAQFLDMMQKAPPHGKYSFTHGTCPSVGAFGYHLHGGWGATNAQWANRAIVELEVVLGPEAEKRVLKRDDTTESNQQLFRAFTRAPSSFGVVTSMTIELHPYQDRVFHHFFVENDVESLLKLFESDKNAREGSLPFGWVGFGRWDSSVYSTPGFVANGAWVLGKASPFLEWLFKHAPSLEGRTLGFLKSWFRRKISNLLHLRPRGTETSTTKGKYYFQVAFHQPDIPGGPSSGKGNTLEKNKEVFKEWLCGWIGEYSAGTFSTMTMSSS